MNSILNPNQQLQNNKKMNSKQTSLCKRVRLFSFLKERYPIV
ncbi:hypothetical protein HPNQ4200_1484 [Helicobacter pylori NQ4200]|uniref:Uncharacterized protein n=1 Tax=Helicobacter pylori NQ4200 TaxID=992024 RepID=I9PXY7_HELPX|nr:hypothetical protein HPNQ4200_1484 [Helicobacter pylori NQ4200]